MKYAHVFAIEDRVCGTCGDQPHSMALVSNYKTMANARRVAQCTGCQAIVDAPIDYGYPVPAELQGPAL